MVHVSGPAVEQGRDMLPSFYGLRDMRSSKANPKYLYLRPAPGSLSTCSRLVGGQGGYAADWGSRNRENEPVKQLFLERCAKCAV